MPHRFRKIRKKRGSRTQGYGQIGQHRKGSKGERKVGRHKHGWTYTIKYQPEYFRKRGFSSQRGLEVKNNIINVGELDELLEKLALEKKLEKKGKKLFLDLDRLGYAKLLGKGRIDKPVMLKIASHSKGAAKKIDEAGGQILEQSKPTSQ